MPSRSEFSPALRAIALKTLSVALFTVMGALIKSLGTRIPTGEVVFFRSLFAFLPVLLLVQMHGGLTTLRTRRVGSHLRRSVPGLGGMAGGFAALSMLPLAEATAINFTVPILTTVLAIPMLGERVGKWRGGAVILGFFGMLLIVRPGIDALSPGALYGLAGATSTAFAMIAIRRMNAEEPSVSIVFYYTCFCTSAGALSLLWRAVTPTEWELAALIGAGIIGGSAQMLMTLSYRLAPASIVAPFDYVALLFAVVGGYAIWGEIPAAMTLIGAAVVIASGLIILMRERQGGGRVMTAGAPPPR